MRLACAEIGFFEDYEEEETLEVAFHGTDEAGLQRSFSIQRSTYEPDEQEIQNGMDSYCVSNERGLTLYGCLSHVSVEDAVLTLRLDEEDAGILESDVVVEIEFSGWNGNRRELFGKLREILEWGADGKRPELTGFDGH